MNAAGSFLYKVLVGYALATGTARGLGAKKAADKLDARVLPQLDRAAALKERVIDVLNQLGDNPRQAFSAGYAMGVEWKRNRAGADDLSV